MILSLDDVSKNPYLRFQLGWNFDFDTIMINQIAFAFYRAEMYIERNDTEEYWSWETSRYKSFLSSVDVDY